MKNKTLFTFTVPVEKLVKESIASKDETGANITIVKEVKKIVQRGVTILRLTRSQNDEAQMAYTKKLNRCISEGILTRTMLTKRFSDNGGVFSKFEAEEYNKNAMAIQDAQKSVREVFAKYPGQRDVEKFSDEDRALIADAEITFQAASIGNQQLEEKYSNEFNNTAEALAVKERILFLSLALAQWDKDGNGKFVHIFPGSTHEERYKALCDLEDNDEDAEEYKTYLLARTKLSYIMALIDAGRVSTQAEFERVNAELDAQLNATLEKKPETKEEKKEDKAPVETPTETKE